MLPLFGPTFHSCAVSLITQSCPALCDPMYCSPPSSSVCGILQAGILERISRPFSRGSSWPWDQTWSLMSPALAGRFFSASATWELCFTCDKLCQFQVYSGSSKIHIVVYPLPRSRYKPSLLHQKVPPEVPIPPCSQSFPSTLFLATTDLLSFPIFCFP